MLLSVLVRYSTTHYNHCANTICKYYCLNKYNIQYMLKDQIPTQTPDEYYLPPIYYEYYLPW